MNLQRLFAALAACGLLFASVGTTSVAAQEREYEPDYFAWYDPSDWFGDEDAGYERGIRDAIDDDESVDRDRDARYRRGYGDRYAPNDYQYDLYTEDWYEDEGEFDEWYQNLRD